MKKILIALLLTVSLSAHGAESFDDGVQAVDSGDYETAFRVFFRLAEQGNADAQHNLGVMYETGLGVSENDKKAVKWYRLAAEQGHAAAQYSLGVMYQTGEGVPEDVKEAL